MDPEKSTKLGEIGQDLMVPNTPCPYNALSGEYRAQMWFTDFNNSCNHFVFITHCSFNLHILELNPSRRNVYKSLFE